MKSETIAAISTPGVTEELGLSASAVKMLFSCRQDFISQKAETKSL